MRGHPAVITGVRPGRPVRQGAVWDGRGTSFGLYAERATHVELCLFDDARTERERITLPGHDAGVFHGYLPGIVPGQRYGFRVHGAYDPGRGERANPSKLLIDPYARALDAETRWQPSLQGAQAGHDGARDERDSAEHTARSVVVDDTFDWGDEAPPRTAWRDTLIYECHVKGATKLHPEIAPELRGTYLGLCAEPMIEHLRELGVTALELMPVTQTFSERFLVERGLCNYWGYNPIAFFAPDARFASSGTLGEQVADFKRMVQALHRAGIEVILDVVYNHTGEADALGPTLSLRGIDNAVYYRLDPEDPRRYLDTTGCGNSLNFDHPQTLRLVLDSLRYWVSEMHVDGFRFDLAPTLARGAHGLHLQLGFFAALAQDPLLAGVKLIVEPWDCAGSYTGGFARGYAEWNDRYRDAARRFLRGDAATVADMVTRLAGSSDLFRASGRTPLASINYVTSHDGFSLRDLTSYAHKHNQANGWDNLDGAYDELSDNHGAEGPSGDAEIEAARDCTARGLLALLACSAGVPMLRQGDELGDSQAGNNNAYAHDSEVSWLSWKLGPRERTQLAFVRRAFRMRRERSVLRRADFYSGRSSTVDGPRDVTWLREDGEPLHDWEFHDGSRRAFGMQIEGELVAYFNSGAHAARFVLPQPLRGARLRVLLDSASPERSELEAGQDALVHARSVLVLEREPGRITSRPGGDRSALRTLAAHAGIEPGFHAYQGGWHVTSDDARVALLAAMGCDASSEASARRALEALEAESQRPGLDAVRVLPQGVDGLRQLIVRAGDARRSSGGAQIEFLVELEREDGSTKRFEGQVAAQSVLVLPLPAAAMLAPGYHHLRCSLRGAVELDAEQDLIVTPRSAPSVASRLGEGAAFGVTAHLYALHRRGDHGIGDFGDLRTLAALVAEHGGDFVGHNPLHAVDNLARDVSPYFPSSRIFGNPIYLELEAIPELAVDDDARSLLDRPDRSSTANRGHVDYAATWKRKRAVLQLLHAAFLRAHAARDTQRARAYQAFTQRHGALLVDFATFCVIGDRLGGVDSPLLDARRFPPELAHSGAGGVERFREEHARAIDFQMYLQFELDRQLAACQADARARGMRIGLYGDLAVGNAPGGADTWSRRDLFASGVQLGAPPDAFTADGQTWGLAPLLPSGLVADRYRYFIALCREATRHAGMLRIDHVMGLLRQFWVPDGLRAADGAYVRFPFEALSGIAALESTRTGALIVGEDLGIVPEGLRERMGQLQFLRSQVLYFERDHENELLRPEHYAYGALATINTHDLPPLAAFGDRPALLRLLAREGLPPDDDTDAALVVATHRLLARVRSVLVAASLDDLCLEREPLNTPGPLRDDRSNWSRRARLSVEQLRGDRTVDAVFTALRGRKP